MLGPRPADGAAARVRFISRCGAGRAVLNAGDLDLASLASRGPIDERDIEKSGIASMGTGRAMDALASMLERGVLVRRGDRFGLGRTARDYMWNGDTPLKTRLARLLDVEHMTLQRAAACLHANEDDAAAALDEMRRDGRVILYPLRTDGIRRVYQTTQAGRDGVETTAVERIIQDIESLDMDPQKKRTVISMLREQ